MISPEKDSLLSKFQVIKAGFPQEADWKIHLFLKLKSYILITLLKFPLRIITLQLGSKGFTRVHHDKKKLKSIRDELVLLPEIFIFIVTLLILNFSTGIEDTMSPLRIVCLNSTPMGENRKRNYVGLLVYLELLIKTSH